MSFLACLDYLAFVLFIILANGKDYIDHLLFCAESGMVKVSLDSDERLAESDNRLAVVEGRVDNVRRDLRRSEGRIDVVVARAAEDEDAHQNEKYNLYPCWLCFSISVSTDICLFFNYHA